MSKRKAIPKKVRQSVYLMYNGHCAYCGTEIAYKDMQVDHATPPILSGVAWSTCIAYKDMQVDHATPLRIGGADDISNYMPACRSCNHYKATLDVEGFRKYLSEIHKRLMRDSIPYQVAERFGIVKHMSDNVKFYFEKVEGDDYVENNKERRYCSGDREVSG